MIKIFSRLSRQRFRNSETKIIPKPLGYERLGTNLPFNIANAEALTFKFILFFGSAFYIPFIVLYVQTQRYFEGYMTKENPEKSESSEIYGLAHEEQGKKSPEIYI